MKNFSKETFDEINAYHFKELNAEDNTLFEAKMIINPDLRDQYENFQTVVSNIKEEQRNELLECFTQEDKVLDKDLIHVSLKSKLSVYLIVTAIIAVFLLVFLIRE